MELGQGEAADDAVQEGTHVIDWQATHKCGCLTCGGEMEQGRGDIFRGLKPGWYEKSLDSSCTKQALPPPAIASIASAPVAGEASQQFGTVGKDDGFTVRRHRVM